MLIPIKRRFIERDFVKRKMETNSEYISPEAIESILNERDNWSDYTFKFHSTFTGMYVVVTDNDTGLKVEIDDLNPFAMDFYVRQLVDLTKEKLKNQIQLSIAI